jgi:hypothetical protein
MNATLLGKPIQFVGTAGWNAKYGGLEASLYIKEALDCLTKHPVDMLIFEMPKANVMNIRSAGYDLQTQSKLDEKTILFTTQSLPIEKFWVKVDDYGDKFVATFLFPDEY